VPSRVLTTVAETRAALLPFRRAGQRIGLVPTMGALHEGHLSLVRASKAECDITVVWIYVNPSQFGPHEDLEKYPRTLAADLEKLAGCGTDFVLAPDDAEVYPPGHATWVEVGPVVEPLEGRFRPGHFRGVATVVLKMFNMVQPDAAYFGQKDYQQAAVIRSMAADLNVPVAIRVCPIVRETDGLAMSSRNVYLSPDARQRAVVLWRSLELARRLVAQGQRDAAHIARQMTEMILAAGGQIDYVALVDPESFAAVRQIDGQVLAVLAVKFDGTRLIDNAILECGDLSPLSAIARNVDRKP
jgi:pantoate--beta-alanine ligase